MRYKRRVPVDDRKATRDATRQLVYDGILTKNPYCEVCGRYGTTAHHVDYRNPRLVHWLCEQCHTELHRMEQLTVDRFVL